MNKVNQVFAGRNRYSDTDTLRQYAGGKAEPADL